MQRLTPEREEEIRESIRCAELELITEIDGLRGELTSLRYELDNERCKLLACGAVAQSVACKSIDSKKMDKHHPSWSDSYNDVYYAVERAIKLSAELEKTKKEWAQDSVRLTMTISELGGEVSALRADLQAALDKLGIAREALEYISWPGFDRDHWDRVNKAKEALARMAE